jgi:hypothetical protein
MNEQNLSKDQAALLDQANAIDGELSGAVQAAAQEVDELESMAQENYALLTAGKQILAPGMPFLEICYPDATLKRIAGALAAVEKKHGWNLKSWLNEEAQLALVAIPPTFQAIVMGRMYFAQKRAELQEQQRQQQAGGAPDGSQQ